jgi:hypothetical protein
MQVSTTLDSYLQPASPTSSDQPASPTPSAAESSTSVHTDYFALNPAFDHDDAQSTSVASSDPGNETLDFTKFDYIADAQVDVEDWTS